MNWVLFSLISLTVAMQPNSLEKTLDCDLPVRNLTTLFPPNSALTGKVKVHENDITANSGDATISLKQFFESLLHFHSLDTSKLSLEPCQALDGVGEEYPHLIFKLIPDSTGRASLCQVDNSQIFLTLPVDSERVVADELISTALDTIGRKTQAKIARFCEKKFVLSPKTGNWEVLGEEEYAITRQSLLSSYLFLELLGAAPEKRVLSQCADQNCKTCSDSICTACREGFTPDLSGVCQQCQHFINHCTVCSGATLKCDECEPGHYLHNNQCLTGYSVPECIEYSEGLCHKCKSGYFLANQQCFQCNNIDKACIECSVEGCLECEDTHTLHYGQCTACEAAPECLKYIDTCECAECTSEFYLRNGQCSPNCYKFFTPDDIKVEFDETYTKIVLEFRQKAVKTSSQCEKLIQADYVSLLGEASCSWTDEYSLEILLGRNYSLYLTEISLVGQVFERSEGDCSVDPLELLLPIQTAYSPPIPIFSITSSEFYSIPCAMQDFQLSVSDLTGICNHSPTYNWEIIGPTSFSAGESSAYIFLEKSQLEPGEYRASLTVTNVYGQSTTHSHAFEVTDQSMLSVEIDAGNSLYLNSNEGRVLSARVSEFCGIEEVEFQWTIEGSGDTDSSHILENSSQPYKLQIFPGDLIPDTVIDLKVTASQGDAFGEAFISVFVAPAQLVAKINHTSGKVSNASDLYLSACDSHKLEPIDVTEYTYKWTCEEGPNMDCKATDGNTLTFTDDEVDLTIPSDQLRLGAHYCFILEVSEGSSTAFDEVDLEIVEVETTGLSGVPTELYVNYQKEVIIETRLTASEDVRIQWRQTEGDEVSPSSSTDFPYLRFASYSFSPGQHYSFEVSADFGHSAESAVYSIVTTTDPICMKGLLVNYDGLSHLLTLPECTNTEGFSLTYSFGLRWDDFYLPLMVGSSKNSVKVILPEGLVECVGIVCDSLDTCTSFTHMVGVSTQRRLEEGLIIQSFSLETRNPDMIPIVAYSYITSYSLTSEERNHIFTTVQDYFESLGKLDLLSKASGLSCFVGFATSTTLPKEILETFAFGKFIIENSSTKLSKTDVQLIFKVIDLLETNKNAEIFESVFQLVHLVLTNLLGDVPPNGYAEYIQSLSLSSFVQQVLGTQLAESEITFSDIRVQFPAELPFSDTDVVTVQATSYKNSQQTSDSVDLVFMRTGTYTQYNYSQKPPIEATVTHLDKPFRLSFPCKATSVTDYVCAYYHIHKWTPDCQLVHIEDGICTIESYHASLFSVMSTIELAESCPSSFSPIYVLGIVYAIAMVLRWGNTRKKEEPEQNDDAIKVYALESNFMDQVPNFKDGIRSPREIVIVETKPMNTSDFEDIITPEFRANTNNFGGADEEFADESELSQTVSIEISSSCGVFLRHHLLFGQSQEYYYSKSLRPLLLALNATVTFACTGLMVGLDELQTAEDFLFIGVVSALGSLVVVSTLEYLLAVGRQNQALGVLGLGLSWCILISALLLCCYWMVSGCAEATLLWNRVATITLVTDLLLLQSIIALLKATALTK